MRLGKVSSSECFEKGNHKLPWNFFSKTCHTGEMCVGEVSFNRPSFLERACKN